MYNASYQKKTVKGQLTIADIERALYICAYFIMKDKEPNRKLIPLFERIEREIETMEKEQKLMNRIQKLAKKFQTDKELTPI